MAKSARRSPRARQAKGPQDVGLRLKGEEITFTARFPNRGTVIGRLGDSGFRLTIDVAEEHSRSMKRMWDLIQTSFETHVSTDGAEAVAFMASFPTRGGAINRHGDGGFRLTLDVAEDEAAPMMLLVPFIQKDLHVTVGPRLGALPGTEPTQSDGGEPAAPSAE